MTDRFRIPSTLPRRLEELGLVPAAVLQQAGLPAGLLNQEKILLTTEEFFALYRAISEASDDPALGLKLGSEGRVERYDAITIAVLSARSFRDALQRIALYKQLLCPERIHIEERGAESTVRFEWLLAEEEEPAMLTDICFAWVVGIARRGTGRAISPTRVEFQRKPVHREMYQVHFGCPVKFKADENTLVFSKEDIQRPFATHNPELLAMVVPQLDAELAEQLVQKPLSEQTKGVMKRLLAGRRPAIQDVAKELRLSSRTLQRRLTEQGVTFQRLLEDARRELARHYLIHSSLELNETAYLLGYEDANSFFRAFHNWEGVSPGQWRVNQKGSYSATPPYV